MVDEVVERERAQVTRGFTVSGFPIALWNEWDADCKANFGDCRWIKMWNDHLKSNAVTDYQLVMVKLKELEDKIQVLQNELLKKEQVKQGVQTFGGTVI